MSDDDNPTIPVAALHALEYCERLYYLEWVEEIRIADESVYAGRTLHEELAGDEAAERRTFEFSSESLGLTGKVDALRHREGGWVPYEHKRGRSRRGAEEVPEAWPSDALQVSAYGMLLEEATGRPVAEGRVRYHAENVTARVPLDGAAREAVRKAVERARALRAAGVRPQVTANERLCLRCSLAPVCLPEEERLAQNPAWEPVRLFPPHPDGQAVHVVSPSARVSRSGETLVVKDEERKEHSFPIQSVSALVIHGHAQATTQALYLCAARGVSVHWFTGGGRYVGGLAAGPGPVQRRIRQYQALSDPGVCLRLARRLAMARAEGQLRFLLRATRGEKGRLPEVDRAAGEIRQRMREMVKAEGVDALRGLEGSAARAYFEALPLLLGKEIPDSLRPRGRTRRPPRDRFNALLSFGYALLYRSVHQAILAVGLEPALGFFHTPRSSAHPLVLDLMELFRVPVWDMSVVASINRRQWDPEADFSVARDHVWLSDAGRRKAIDLYEGRLEEVWKHPVTGYSLSYARMIELEARLLEKEWTSQPGLFAKFRLR